MNQHENSFTNGEDCNKTEIINNFGTLLNEYSQGIPLTTLEDIYKTKFNKSLLSELIRLALSDILQLVTITQKYKEDGSYDNIIALKSQENMDDIVALKSQEEIDQIQNQVLQEITASGIVPGEFNYNPNPLMSNDGTGFFACVSNIDRNNHCIYMQPECDLQNMEKLTDELEAYYSHCMSKGLLVKEVLTGLSCVSKYQGVYHRVFIKENHPLKYVITYVDLGLTEEVKTTEIQFKHLLNYFATLPCMAIPCRLLNIDFKLINYQMPLETCKELYALCQGGSLIIEPYDQVNNALNVVIYNTDLRSLNDIVVEKGLAFSGPLQLKPAISFTVANKNGEDQGNTQKFQSSVNSVQTSLNHIHKTNHTPKTADPNQDYLTDDYENDAGIDTQSTTTSISTSNADDDYDIEDTALTQNDKSSKHQVPIAKSAIKYDNNSNRKRVTNTKTSKPTNQSSQQSLQNKERPTQLKVTIHQNIPGARRLFGSALSSLSSNKFGNQRQVSCSVISSTRQKKDEFANWMCSWSINQSLWTSEEYKNALLAYLGRIYGLRAHMYRLFAQLKDFMQNFDELDVLHELIKKTKQQCEAQTSLGKWEDNSRVDRRIKDLRFIFEFDGDYRSSNHPFNVTPTGLRQIINRQTVRSYFDLGCGDGIITAGIGAYLGLTKENIFGGDVYEGQSKKITFVKVNENQSTINLPANRVDLITSFVTFHHVSQVEKTLSELARILQPGGYLIMREHDCKTEYSRSAKYLNFVHAIMMIAQVGEFANSPSNQNNESQLALSSDYENDTNDWTEQKSRIIEYTKSIHYRTCDEWRQELGRVGFRLCATLYYGAGGSSNPQKLFYAVYQLDKK